MESIHRTVLLKETIDGLNLRNGATVIDATFGGGGHSAEICRRDRSAKIIGLDQDHDAWLRAKNKFEDLSCDINFHNLNFRDLDKAAGGEEADAIIFDLGLSSDQLQLSGRGFSFQNDEPLLMTMKAEPTDADLTAIDVVNTWEEKNLADIIYGYGEERYARRIARSIVEARRQKKIQTTWELVRAIEAAVPESYRRGRIHYATRTFQAIRIAVNDELRALEQGLRKGFEILKKSGRLAVISFHSHEDRIVKRFFKELDEKRIGAIVTKKPIQASEEEIMSNPRARSAKLRILEKK